MRLVSIIVAVIIIFFLVFSYFKVTKKVLDENAPGATDNRIEWAKETMDDMNRVIEEQKKAADKVLEK